MKFSFDIQDSGTLYIDMKYISEGQSFAITYQGEECGNLEFSQGKLSITINKKMQTLTLEGDINCSSTTIKTTNSLKLNLKTLVTDNLDIESHKLLSNTTIDAKNVDFNCQAILINQPITATNVTLHAQGDIIIQRKITTQQNNTFSGNNIKINAEVEGQENRFTATTDVKVSNKVISHQKCVMRAKNVYKHAETDTTWVERVYCDQYHTSKKSNSRIDGLLKVICNTWQHEGTLTGGHTAYLVIQNFINRGFFILPQEFYLQCDSFTLTEGAFFGWTKSQTNNLENQILEIKIDKKLSIDPTAKVRLRGTSLQVTELDNKGKLSLKAQSICSGTTFTTTGDTKIDNSEIDFTIQVTTQDAGALALTRAHVKTSYYNISGAGEHKDLESSIEAELIDIHSFIDSIRSNYQADFLSFFNTGSVSDSVMTVVKELELNGAQSPMFNHVVFNVASLRIATELLAENNSEFKLDVLLLLGNACFNQANIESNLVTVAEGASFDAFNGGALSIANFQNNGVTTLEEVSYQITQFINNGSLSLINLSAQIDATLYSPGDLQANNVRANGERLSLPGTYQVDQSTFTLRHYYASGNGVISADTKITADFLHTTETADLTVFKAQMDANFALVKGQMRFDKSSLTAAYVSQERGDLQFSASRLTVAEQMRTGKNSGFSTSNNTVVSAANSRVHFAGETKIEQTRADISYLNIGGHTTIGKNSQVKVNDTTSVTGSLDLRDKGVLLSNDTNVLGYVAVTNGAVLKTKNDFTKTKSGHLTVDDARVITKKKFDAYGGLSLDYGAYVAAETANIYRRLKLAHQSNFVGKKDVTLHVTSVTTSNNNSMIKGENVNSYGIVNGDGAYLFADKKLTFMYCGLSFADRTKLKGADIYFSPTTAFFGHDMDINSEVFENETDISLSNAFRLRTKYLYSTFNNIIADEVINIEAERAIFRLCSGLQTKVGTINTLFNFNFWSYTYAQDRLTRNSLVNFDIASANFSYAHTNNALLNVNGGLNCFAFPSSWRVAFNKEHFVPAMFSLINIILPDQAGLINVGRTASMLGIDAARGLYSVCKNPKQSWQEITSFASSLKDKRALEFLPLALKLKSVGVAIANVITGAQQFDYHHGFSADSLHNIPSHIEDLSFNQLVDAARTIFGPTLVQETVFDFECGFSYAPNNISNSLVYIETGYSSGYRNTIHSQLLINEGHVSGDNVALSGNRLVNNGELRSEGQESLQFHSVKLEDNSHITNQNNTIVIKADRVDQWGGDAECNNLVASGMPVDNLHDFLETTGEYKNFRPHDSLTYTDEKAALVVAWDIGAKYAVSVGGKTVDVTVDQKSTAARSFSAEEDLTADVNIEAEQGVTLKSKKNVTTTKDHHYKAEKGQVALIAGESVTNEQGDVEGARVLAVAEKGEVTNHGGKMLGDTVLIEAEDDVNNTSVAYDAPAAHHTTHKKYLQGEIGGASGSGNHGKAVVIHSKNGSVKNTGIVAAKQDVVIEAAKGVTSEAETNVYLEEYKETHNLFGHHKKVVTNTEVSRPELVGHKVTVIAHDGDVKMTGVVTKSDTDIDVFVLNEGKEKHNLITEDVIAERHVSEDDRWLGGLFKQQMTDDCTYSVPTVLTNGEGYKIHLEAPGGDVRCRATEFNGGKLEVVAENFLPGASITQEDYEYTSTSLVASIAGFGIGRMAAPKPTAQLPENGIDSSKATLKATKEAKKGLEGALAGGSEAIDIINNLQKVGQAAHGNLGQVAKDEAGYSQFDDPQLTLGLSHTHVKSHTETEHPTTFNLKGMSVHAHNEIKMDGVQGNISEDAEFSARHMEINGRELNCSSESESSSETIGMGLVSGKTTVSSSSNESQQNNHIYKTSKLKIGGKLELHLEEELGLNGGYMEADSAEGEVDKINITSHTSERHEKDSSASTSTTGAYRYSQHHSDSTKVDDPAGIHVHKSIDKLKIKDGVDSEGGVFTSDGEMHTDANINSKPIHERTDTHGFSVAGNVNDFKQSQASLTPSANGEQSAKLINTIAITYNVDVVDDMMNTAVAGAKGTTITGKTTGTVITDSLSPRVYKTNTHHEYHLTIPVATHDAMVQLRDNVTYLARILGFTSPPKKDFSLRVEPIQMKRTNKMVKKKIVSKKTTKKKVVIKQKTDLQPFSSDLDDSALKESLSLETNVTYINNSKSETHAKQKQTFFNDEMVARTNAVMNAPFSVSNESAIVPTSTSMFGFFVNDAQAAQTPTNTSNTNSTRLSRWNDSTVAGANSIASIKNSSLVTGYGGVVLNYYHHMLPNFVSGLADGFTYPYTNFTDLIYNTVRIPLDIGYLAFDADYDGKAAMHFLSMGHEVSATWNNLIYHDGSAFAYHLGQTIGFIGGIVSQYEIGAGILIRSQIRLAELTFERAEKPVLAQMRQWAMIRRDVGYNVLPVKSLWRETVGRDGELWLTDIRTIRRIIGQEVEPNVLYKVGFFTRARVISYFRTRQLMEQLGTSNPKMYNGFVISEVPNLGNLLPRSPLEGGEFYLGPGIGLYNGQPEVVIESLDRNFFPWSEYIKPKK